MTINKPNISCCINTPVSDLAGKCEDHVKYKRGTGAPGPYFLLFQFPLFSNASPAFSECGTPTFVGALFQWSKSQKQQEIRPWNAIYTQCIHSILVGGRQCHLALWQLNIWQDRHGQSSQSRLNMLGGPGPLFPAYLADGDSMGGESHERSLLHGTCLLPQRQAGSE